MSRPRVIVFNGWAAGPEAWSLCTFPHDWIFDYLEELDGLPERILAEFDEVILVGFSMGGHILMRLLPKIIDKVRGLVLVSTTPNMMEDPSTGWKGFTDHRLKAFRLGTQLLFKNDPSPLYASANLDRGLEFLRTTDVRDSLRNLAATHRFDFPVAIFQSARDGIVRPHNAAFLKEIFPAASVTMVPGSEHVLPVLVPEAIDAAVHAMLGSEWSQEGTSSCAEN